MITMYNYGIIFTKTYCQKKRLKPSYKDNIIEYRRF